MKQIRYCKHMLINYFIIKERPQFFFLNSLSFNIMGEESQLNLLCQDCGHTCDFDTEQWTYICSNCGSFNTGPDPIEIINRRTRKKKIVKNTRPISQNSNIRILEFANYYGNIRPMYKSKIPAQCLLVRAYELYQRISSKIRENKTMRKSQNSETLQAIIILTECHRASHLFPMTEISIMMGLKNNCYLHANTMLNQLMAENNIPELKDLIRDNENIDFRIRSYVYAIMGPYCRRLPMVHSIDIFFNTVKEILNKVHDKKKLQERHISTRIVGAIYFVIKKYSLPISPADIEYRTFGIKKDTFNSTANAISNII